MTDTFLRKYCTTRKRKALTPLVQENVVAGDVDKFVTIKVYSRKTNKMVLYAECREDFIDLLFSFLAILLEFSWELSVDNVNMGCAGNLNRSVKDLSFEKQKEATVSECMLDIVIKEGKSEIECLFPRNGHPSSHCKFSRKIKKDVLLNGERIVKFTPPPSKYNKWWGWICKGRNEFYCVRWSIYHTDENIINNLITKQVADEHQ